MPVITRIVGAVLIAFLSAVTGAAAQTSVKGPMRVFDFTFPEEIAGAQRFNIADHESSQPGLGHSAGYRQGNLTGTVYIYATASNRFPTIHSRRSSRRSSSSREQTSWVYGRGSVLKLMSRKISRLRMLAGGHD